MKKRLLSILLMCCMVLTLLPTTAFAEGSAEEQSACTCETVCAVESMNADCHVCGAEGAAAENCAKYVKPADGVPSQPKGEPAVLNGEGETVIKLTQSNISDYMSSGLTDGSYQLDGDVTVESDSLEVKGTVTLDLNGHTLLFKDPELYYPPEQGQVNAGIRVYNSDSSESAAKYALTLCDTSTAKTGTLNVWGESMAESGEGLFVGQNGELTMTGGTITDSSGTNPWGIGIGIIEGRVTMTGGKIENQTRCGVTLAGGTFEMSGDAVISNCGGNNSGGGIWIGGGTLTMTGGTIRNCKATQGGGVYVGAGTFNMSDGSIKNCKASADGSSAFGGGIYNAGRTTLSGTAKIRNCQAANAGGGIYDYSILNISDNVEITGCTAPLWSAMIVSGTISGGTFNGTVTSNGTIIGGTFNGEVRNVGTITGGTFNGQVTNPGRITGGTFKGGITGIPALATGSGTEDDPYQIGTAIGLEWFRDKVNDASSIDETKICAELTADIVLDANESWEPIGYASYYDETKAYSGTFDGQGHTISGLKADAVVSGLFGYTKNAAIKNLTVAGSVGGGNCSTAVGGIVGYAVGGTIENCGNLCGVAVPGSSPGGGIVGFASNLTITGCYNAGLVHKGDGSSGGGIVGKGENVNIYDCYNVGKVEGFSGRRGGIVGDASGPVFVYNCYNAGNVVEAGGTGDANKTVCGIVGGGDGPVQIKNCYYLEGTKADAGATAKTAEEFSNGTVLKLLKAGERGSNADPWDSACKYVAAAKMTLPVFKGQGDAHTHNWGAWTSNGDGTHSRVCACGVTETANCSGGTATCTAKATCADCGAEYGNHHGDKLKHVVAKDATTREEGNIEYWHCEACGKYFSDNAATKEITQAETVIPKRQSSGSNYNYYTIKATAGTGGAISPSGNVSVREGRNQTFTITPDQGYAVSDVKIDGESVGVVTSYSFENVRKAHTIAVSFATIKTFVDVPAGSYYEDAVDWAVENGITQGTDDTHFSPDGICTRAQAVTFLWRAAGSPEPETRAMPFTDVPVGSYYYDAVLWAVENGITKGTSDTTFSPDATCSRAQIVAFLWRSEKSPAAGTANPFADVKSTAYYADAVLWAVKEDITKGTTNTTFSPNADCTRAQIVTFLWRCKK